MKIAVLFDGAGLARLGLEQAGHECTGFELDPKKHELSKFVGSGNSILADVRDVKIESFDAVWASPPCQLRSIANRTKNIISPYSVDLLSWALSLPNDVLWVENVGQSTDWGIRWNAAQFEKVPRQCRNRIIGGRYLWPKIYRPYQRSFPDICPAITATEYKGMCKFGRGAPNFYGRKLTIEECAYHQGFEIPFQWYSGFEIKQIYMAIGNGVPVYMARAFGEVYV